MADSAEEVAPNPRRSNMQANRRRDTKPEMVLRRRLFERGLRYFVDRRPLPELRWRADIVFPRSRVAVFVDGCYWHGCPDHFAEPTKNTEYWRPKIAGNMQRDAQFNALLDKAGWTVIRAWEHEDPTLVADKVERAVRAGRSGPS